MTTHKYRAALPTVLVMSDTTERYTLTEHELLASERLPDLTAYAELGAMPATDMSEADTAPYSIDDEDILLSSCRSDTMYSEAEVAAMDLLDLLDRFDAEDSDGVVQEIIDACYEVTEPILLRKVAS